MDQDNFNPRACNSRFKLPAQAFYLPNIFSKSQISSQHRSSEPDQPTTEVWKRTHDSAQLERADPLELWFGDGPLEQSSTLPPPCSPPQPCCLPPLSNLIQVVDTGLSSKEQSLQSQYLGMKAVPEQERGSGYGTDCLLDLPNIKAGASLENYNSPASKPAGHLPVSGPDDPYPMPSVSQAQQRMPARKQLCDICKKSFAKCSMKYHRLQHMGKKPYKCTYPQCDRAYCWPGALTQHKSTHNRKCANLDPP